MEEGDEIWGSQRRNDEGFNVTTIVFTCMRVWIDLIDRAPVTPGFKRVISRIEKGEQKIQRKQEIQFVHFVYVLW